MADAPLRAAKLLPLQWSCFSHAAPSDLGMMPFCRHARCACRILSMSTSVSGHFYCEALRQKFAHTASSLPLVPPPRGWAFRARRRFGAMASRLVRFVMVRTVMMLIACSVKDVSEHGRRLHTPYTIFRGQRCGVRRHRQNDVLLSVGASPAFKQKDLAVVGGGDTALEEAVYLTKYGKHVSAANMTLR